MVYVFFADGFEEIEGIAPVDILRRCDINVTTVGIGSNVITGAHGIQIAADIMDEEVKLDDMEAIVLPGGMPGTLNLERSSCVRNAVSTAVEQNKYIAAICAAPSILGHMGILDGVEAICFPGFENELYGAVISDKKVVSCGQFITAAGPGAAVEFGLEISRKLTDSTKVDVVERSLQKV